MWPHHQQQQQRPPSTGQAVPSSRPRPTVPIHPSTTTQPGANQPHRYSVPPAHQHPYGSQAPAALHPAQQRPPPQPAYPSYHPQQSYLPPGQQQHVQPLLNPHASAPHPSSTAAVPPPRPFPLYGSPKPEQPSYPPLAQYQAMYGSGALHQAPPPPAHHGQGHYHPSNPSHRPSLSQAHSAPPGSSAILAPSVTAAAPLPPRSSSMHVDADYNAAMQASQHSADHEARQRLQDGDLTGEERKALEVLHLEEERERRRRQEEEEEEELRLVMEQSLAEERDRAAKEQAEEERRLMEVLVQSKKEEEERHARERQEEEEALRRSEEESRRRREEEQRMEEMERLAVEESRKEMEREWQRREEEDRAMEALLEQAKRESAFATAQRYGWTAVQDEAGPSGSGHAASSSGRPLPAPPTVPPRPQTPPRSDKAAAAVQDPQGTPRGRTASLPDVGDASRRPSRELTDAAEVGGTSNGERAGGDDVEDDDPFCDGAEAPPSYEDARRDRPPVAPAEIPEHVAFAPPPEGAGPSQYGEDAEPAWRSAEREKTPEIEVRASQDAGPSQAPTTDISPRTSVEAQQPEPAASSSGGGRQRPLDLLVPPALQPGGPSHPPAVSPALDIGSFEEALLGPAPGESRRSLDQGLTGLVPAPPPPPKDMLLQQSASSPPPTAPPQPHRQPQDSQASASAASSPDAASRRRSSTATGPSSSSTSVSRFAQSRMPGTDFGYAHWPFQRDLVRHDEAESVVTGKGRRKRRTFPGEVTLLWPRPDETLPAAATAKPNVGAPYFVVRAHSWQGLLRALAWYGNARIEGGPEEVADAAAAAARAEASAKANGRRNTAVLPLQLQVEVEFITPTRANADLALSRRKARVAAGAAPANGRSGGGGYLMPGGGGYSRSSVSLATVSSTRSGQSGAGAPRPSARVSVCISLLPHPLVARKGSDAAQLRLSETLRRHSRELDSYYASRGSTRRVIKLLLSTSGQVPSAQSHSSSARERAPPSLPLGVVGLAQYLHSAHRFSALCPSSGSAALHTPRDLHHAVEAHDSSYVGRMVEVMKSERLARARKESVASLALTTPPSTRSGSRQSSMDPAGKPSDNLHRGTPGASDASSTGSDDDDDADEGDYSDEDERGEGWTSDTPSDEASLELELELMGALSVQPSGGGSGGGQGTADGFADGAGGRDEMDSERSRMRRMKRRIKDKLRKRGGYNLDDGLDSWVTPFVEE